MVTVSDLRASNADGTDRLFSVELLEFSDGVVSVNSGAFDFTATNGATAAIAPAQLSRAWFNFAHEDASGDNAADLHALVSGPLSGDSIDLGGFLHLTASEAVPELIADVSAPAAISRATIPPVEIDLPGHGEIDFHLQPHLNMLYDSSEAW